MTRFVIGPATALHLAQLDARIPAKHQLLAPTLIRSQLLAHLYGLVRRGELDSQTAERRLDYLRGLRLRLLGDRATAVPVFNCRPLCCSRSREA